MKLTPPSQGAIEQALQLFKSGDFADARLIVSMEAVPQAVWLRGSGQLLAPVELSGRRRTEKPSRTCHLFVARAQLQLA